MTLPGDPIERRLQLERPLAVIDIDSTGLNPETARIVRLSILKIAPDGTEDLRSELMNPQTPIPPGASAVHGLTDDDVADRPTFRAYARALANSLADCDLAGFAIERFHLPLLLAEFRRAGVDFSMNDRAVVDVMAIYHRLEPRDFNSAYRRYVDPEAGEPSLDQGKSQAVLDVLLGQMDSHPELPVRPAELVRWTKGIPDDSADDDGRFTRDESGAITFNFGKYSGESLDTVARSDPSYVGWIASNDSFSSEARKLAAEAIEDLNDTF